MTLDQRRIFILPTREGIGFLLMVAAIFVGGVNYANSLILAVSFILVSLFLVSILHTWGNLVELQVEAGRSENAFAGEDAVFWLTLISNGRDYEAIDLDWGGDRCQQVDMIDCREQAVRMLLPVEQRGRWSPTRLRIESRFPLGLLRAWSWVDLDVSCLVYPRPQENEYPRRLSGHGEQGERLQHEGSDDFEGLRAYVTGDNPRHIAWKNFARTGELHSKMFSGHEDHELWLEWDAWAGLGIEDRLSRICYWVVRFSEEGRRWGLRLPGVEIAPGEGEAHCQACLEQLSLYGLPDDASNAGAPAAGGRYES